MARLRKAVCYRKLERPYTRVSKFKKSSFIKTSYNSRIVKFVCGNFNKQDFGCNIMLNTKIDLQIRDNAVESARLSANRILEKELGRSGFFLRVCKYPFHILRNNPIASGAGADRFSTGMQKSFGKPIGQSAQFKKGDAIFRLSVDPKNKELGKKALKRASYKLPCACAIVYE